MARLRLAIGNTVLADTAADGVTRWMRAEKPELRLRAGSEEIVGMKYARNSARAWGMSLQFSVTVGRQFANYYAAEAFALSHLCKLSEGANGCLSYSGYFGKRYAFKNAVLESAKLSTEIGVSTEFEYVFRCGEPVPNPPAVVTVGAVAVKLGGKIVIIKV